MKKLLLILVLLPVLILAAGYYLLNASKEVDVEWTEADFDSYVEKSGITYDGTNATLDQMFLNEFRGVGEMEIDVFGTHEEITARLNKAVPPDGLVQNPRVRFRDDGKIEFSCTIGDNFETIYRRYPETRNYESIIEMSAGRSLYFVQELSLKEDKQGFDARFTEFYVGVIPIPVGTANTYGGDIGAEADHLINSIAGFSAEEFYFDNEGMYFKGTVPEKIEGSTMPQ